MNQELHQAIRSALQTAANLKLVPPLCAGRMEGRRIGSRTGGAMEFADYRSYQEGDDFRRIDWRLYARSEQLMVRRFAQETDPRCDIIIDRSLSMDFYGKSAASAGCAALFAESALNGGFAVQVWEMGSSLLKMTAPEQPELWELSEKGSRSIAPELFDQLRTVLYRNGLRIFISDLFFDLSPGELMKFLGGGSVVIIQIAGAEEIEPLLSGSVTVSDPESGKSKTICVDEVSIERYKKRFAQFQKEYAEAVRSRNGSVFFFNASQLMEGWGVELFCREGVLQ